MDRSTKKRRTLVGALIGMGATLALVIGLGVLAGAGVAASSQNEPKNDTRPTISGSVQVGQTLTGTTGTWRGNPRSFRYQWLRCDENGNRCSKISGATGTAYTITSADGGSTIRFRVEAINQDGHTFATSLATAKIGSTAGGTNPPVNTSLPTVSGTPRQGQVLTGQPGSWNGNPGDYNYYWLRCDRNGASCAQIGGANNAKYTLASSDVGNTLRFRVDAKNGGGTTTAYSVPTAVIAAAADLPRNTSRPTISGTAVVNRVLTMRAGTWTGTQPITYRYQWYRCDRNGNGCVLIRGATGLTWRILTASVGHTIRTLVTATNSGGTAKHRRFRPQS